MSFRKIRPSFGESSPSTSYPSQSTSESTGSDPRRSHGEKEAENTTNTSKRRRVPDSVTRNACANCKKARAKCDGKKPCSRCATRVEASPCIYEVHIKHAKEELVKQIKDLKAKDHLTEQILHALSADEKVSDILELLKNGETYESIVGLLVQSTTEDFYAISPRGSQHSAFEASDHEMGGVPSAFQWTFVTSDSAVLDHLFQLYFAWVHPVQTLFSEGHFVDSYKRQSRQYCSSVLVNALCAMACHLHSVAEADEIDFEQLGTEFTDAVRSSIEPEDKSITTIQAFAVMFLVDCARGKGLRAASYLKVASNSLSSAVVLEIEGFLEVLTNTSRGIRSLNVEWAQITFQVPESLGFVPSEDVDDNYGKLDDAKWYFYRYVNDQCPAWPGLLATTNREKTKLIDIIHDVATMMYTKKGPRISANNVLSQYSRFVTWRKELPSIIGNIENNNSQALPHVLSLLILYSNAVIQLLRPLLDFEGFPTGLVEEVIWNHAQQGLHLLDEHYRTQYTCRYQPVLQMFAVLHLCDIVARFFPTKLDESSKDGSDALQLGMEVLMQSHLGFPVAGIFLEILRKTLNECSVLLPRNLSELLVISRPPKSIFRMDDFIDACTMPTYAQPVKDIHMRYLPSFSTEWTFSGTLFGFKEPEFGARKLKVASEEERGAQNLMQIRNLLNTN